MAPTCRAPRPFPWSSAPAYLVRDNVRAYGHVFKSRVRAMSIRDRPISPGSPWQNPYVARLIGTVRRECLAQVLLFGEAPAIDGYHVTALDQDSGHSRGFPFVAAKPITISMALDPWPCSKNFLGKWFDN